VYGSLARLEWTSGSDLDWSLLINGAVDPEHVRMAHDITKSLAELEGHNAPGREGVFGTLTFSHELVHRIGGQDDSNRNLTQRTLLLLESCAVGDDQAYSQVLRSILARYCEEDSHLYSREERHFKVPRFLLNDIVRLWRTMAVDYVNKRKQRNDQGWALRNAKLRLSRKLIFASGLLMCFNGRLAGVPGEKEGASGEHPTIEPFINFLADHVSRTPLDILAEALVKNASQETATRVLGSYDKFLEILDDPPQRKTLSTLAYHQADGSSIFNEIRSLGRQFEEGLESLFFMDNERLARLTRGYGVF
jgi:hypothetical protein